MVMPSRVWRMPCRPSTSECGKGSEPHLIQSSTSLTSTASKAEEQILNWLKSLHHRKQRILWGLILDLKEFFYVSIQKKNLIRSELLASKQRAKQQYNAISMFFISLSSKETPNSGVPHMLKISKPEYKWQICGIQFVHPIKMSLKPKKGYHLSPGIFTDCCKAGIPKNGVFSLNFLFKNQEVEIKRKINVSMTSLGTSMSEVPTNQAATIFLSILQNITSKEIIFQNHILPSSSSSLSPLVTISDGNSSAVGSAVGESSSVRIG
ncbi:hypothetical protein NQ317_010340 [Molorchus minor]|uniref:Uncharacterized protein n=1 Tax=Molorchus minor TaxID=1323400 RepID=A0ABQ9JTP2_9CUCU|nr:hypothetical protein NQ317_010340 [Molorchus minor]